MNPEQLLEITKTAIEEMKGSETQIFDVRTMTSITDYMVICTARSSKHAQSIAEDIAIKAKENNIKSIHTEGQQEGEWILVDLGDVVAHVMQASARTFYSLEDLWQPLKDIRENSNNS